MADHILSSCKNSPFVTSITSLETTSMAYNLSQNYPAISKKLHRVSPISQPSGAPFGQDMIFEVPQNFIINGMIIQNNLVIAGDNTASDYSQIGERVFSNVTFSCKGQQFYNQTDGACKVYGKTQNSLVKVLTHCEMTGEDVTMDDTNAVTCYTPVYSEFFGSHTNNLDALFADKITVRCTFNNLSRMSFATGAGLTSSTHYLWLSGYNVSDEEHQKMLRETYKDNIPKGFLSNNFFQETYAVANGSTSYSVDCRCPGVVDMMGFYLKDSVGDLSEITSYSFSVGGQKLYNNVTHRIQEWDLGLQNISASFETLGFNSAGNAITTCGVLKPTVIKFGIDGDSTFNSGCLPFSAITQPTLDLVFPDPGEAVTLFVVYRNHTIVSSNPADGKLSVSSMA